MATVLSGPMKGFSGTVDGITYYQLPNGTTVAKKKNKSRTKPATKGQVPVLQDTAICAKFMKPLKEFTLIGFDLEAKLTEQNHNNVMVSHLRKNAFVGVYPNREIDPAKVLLTKGAMPAPTDVTTEMTEEGVVVTWDTSLIPKQTFYSDQIIIVAYFKGLDEVRYIGGGAERRLGKDLLILDGIKKGNDMEIYVAFVSDDRKSISNSVYLGQHTW